jgi:fatty acid-binding protein DegV
LPEQRAELDLRVVPFVVSLEGKLYREDGDIQPDEV